MNTLEAKKNEITLASIIRLLREIAFLGVLVYLAIKLFSGDLSLNFAKLSASELVGLLLAFFSIALSAAFYFAATNQSNQFYDNVNKFTKETSELLGRVDEQVKGLGGRQTELKNSIDSYYAKGGSAIADQSKEVFVAEAKIVEQNRNEIVSELLDKTNLTGVERTSFEQKLKTKDEELNSLRDRLGRLAIRSESSIMNFTTSRLSRMDLTKAFSVPPAELLIAIIKSGPTAYRRDLFASGFISMEDPTSAKDVTRSGETMVMAALSQAFERVKPDGE